MPKYSDRHLGPIRDAVRSQAVDLGRVFRRQDLVAWGIPGDTVVHMLRRGWWVRLHHGVYSDARDLSDDSLSPDFHLLQVAASIRALNEAAFAFGASAALVHGLAMPRGRVGRVELVRPRGREGRSLSRRISTKDHLPPALVRTHVLHGRDVMVVAGIPTVSSALAAVSAAADCEPDWIVALLDSAAWRAPELIDEMRDHAARLQHLHGIGEVRAAMPLVRTGAQTPLETLSRLRLVRCGLPEPQLQVPFHDEEGLIGYVDMWFDELGVIGEADGLLKYRTGNDLIAEKLREDRLRMQHPVVRWDWQTMWSHPEGLARRIRSAGRQRRAS